jgi:hypothetical protein
VGAASAAAAGRAARRSCPSGTSWSMVTASASCLAAVASSEATPGGHRTFSSRRATWTTTEHIE